MKATTYKLQDWQKAQIKAGELRPWAHMLDGIANLPRLAQRSDWHLLIHPCQGCPAPHAWGRAYCPVLARIVNSQRCHRIQRKDGIAARGYFAGTLQEERLSRRSPAEVAALRSIGETAPGLSGRAASGPTTKRGDGEAPGAADARPASRGPGSNPTARQPLVGAVRAPSYRRTRAGAESLAAAPRPERSARTKGDTVAKTA